MTAYFAAYHMLTKYGKNSIFMWMAQEPPRQSLFVALPTLPPKSVTWIASTKDDISAMPDPVKMSFGYPLCEVQEGKMPCDTKPLPQFGVGVFEPTRELRRQCLSGDGRRRVV